MTPDLVRLSVDLEHVDELIADLEPALRAAVEAEPDLLVGAGAA